MTSWQNILDNLPTGAGRQDTQDANRQQSELVPKLAKPSKNDRENNARPKAARERKLVFLPRQRSVSMPKFNLLGLKPTEDFQPYGLGFFQPRGLVEDETVWKKSLRDMAMSLGFITQYEIDRIEKPPSLSNFYGPPSTSGSLRTSIPSTATNPVPRFNEQLPPPSRGERFSLKGFPKPSWYYRVDDHEREAWMIQVLCQILGTDDISLVQTWLAASHKTERDLARQLIVRALDGLGQGERFRTVLPSLDVDMDSLDNLIKGIDIPQMAVDGVFRPTHKRRGPSNKLRSIDEAHASHDHRTDEEVLAEFSSPTLSVMQTGATGNNRTGETARLRTPFLPPIPARWMMHNDGSLRTQSASRANSDSDLARMNTWSMNHHPTNSSSVFT